MPGRHGCWATVLFVAVLLAGCGGDDEQAAQPADTTRLRVEVTGADSEPISARLTCGGAQPCDRAKLARLSRALAPQDSQRACTLQYGGPERAHVTGTLEGKPVDVTLTRTNGCGIADYKALFGALGRTPPLAP